MIVYLDQEFMCHAAPADGRTEVDVPELDGACETKIKGYRFVPFGISWTRQDGTVFTGPMFAPARASEILDAAQYEHDKGAAALEAALAEIEEALANG